MDHLTCLGLTLDHPMLSISTRTILLRLINHASGHQIALCLWGIACHSLSECPAKGSIADTVLACFAGYELSLIQ